MAWRCNIIEIIKQKGLFAICRAFRKRAKGIEKIGKTAVYQWLRCLRYFICYFLLGAWSIKKVHTKKVWTWFLFQEALEDGIFGFFFGETQRHELQKLATGNFADGRFVNQLCVAVLGGDHRSGADMGFVHDDGVALDMTEAFCTTDEVHMEMLLGVVFCNGTGHNTG